MRKFECKYCKKNCILTVEEHDMKLRLCPYSSFPLYADWHEVKVDSAENAQTTNEQFGNSEQLPSNPRELPDWVKVGAVGYDDMNNEYFKIVCIDKRWVDIEFLDDGNGTTCVYADIQNFSEARKIPFNADEMKALVGKVAEDKDGNAFLIVEFLKEFDEEVEGFSFGVQLSNTYYGAYDLMKLYTIDGKPCFKLEHLNEKGEWVE